MNGNQGLEALAALCGGESAVPTDGSTTNNNSNNNNASSSSNSTKSEATNSPAQQPQAATQPRAALPGAEGFTQQQWQQAVAAAAALGGGPPTAAAPGLTAQSLALLQASLQPAAAAYQQPAARPALDANNAALAAMQQIAYLRYIQEQAKTGQPAAAPAVAASMNHLLHSNPVALALAGQAHLQPSGTDAARHQVLPPAAAPVAGAPHDASTSMPPPPTSGQAGPSTLSTAGIGAPARHTAIAPLPSGVEGKAALAASNSEVSAAGVMLEDKKLQKRAANRRSAQLSRKRKKQFIEELKDENDELRRKEQILRSIPDLIVVFDSTGKLWFVSQSVSRFMKMSAKELEGTSFWDRLCEDSVRLLKAAFMDSLAARTDDSETAPLGSGIWELRLVDKDGSYKVVTLNGVVHFSGDRPECVCSIRPRDDIEARPPQRKQAKTAAGETAANDSSGNGSDETATTEASTLDSSGSSVRFQPLIRAKPHQSVISSSSSSSNGRVNIKAKPLSGSARISDGDSGSTDESGSSDEIEVAD